MERQRQNEESAEQARHLRTAGQMLEERMSWTEAGVRDTSLAGGTSAARAQEAPGADNGRFGFGACAAIPTRELEWRIQWMARLVRVFRTWAGRFFNEDECKKSSEQWRHDLEMKPL